MTECSFSGELSFEHQPCSRLLNWPKPVLKSTIFLSQCTSHRLMGQLFILKLHLWELKLLFFSTMDRETELVESEREIVSLSPFFVTKRTRSWSPIKTNGSLKKPSVRREVRRSAGKRSNNSTLTHCGMGNWQLTTGLPISRSE